LLKSIDRGGLKSHLDSSREILRWDRDDRPSCRELIGGGVVAESTRQSITMHLPSRGCKKLSKRMAMQSNCNGSSTKSESQKNNEISRRSAEREFEIPILTFSRAKDVWLSPLCEQDRLITSTHVGAPYVQEKFS